ncbi:MAG: hypothetical protein IT352_01935, partial [Gemmatimonadales bacterium]|nr:hypothetical protein [Gemmatimonadales bacterium]
QPYSRIADALLDYQYWAPDDPQKNPYDDTGWTFPEGFGVQAVRVVDPKVLDTPMERVTGSIRASGGVTGTGPVVAINHNGDNALATLRFQLRTAEIEAAEEPFEAGGKKFNPGTFLIRGVNPTELDRVTRDLGLSGTALPAAPPVRTHPVRAARVAILHTWTGTQTEGWWRLAFDVNRIPFDYISVQDVAATPDLRAKYDVILFPPISGAAGQAIISGLPMWRNPMPWKSTPETPNLGGIDETDDIRPGLGWNGLQHLTDFVSKGGVLVGVGNTAEFAVQYGLTAGVSLNEAPRSRVVGTLLRSRLVDARSPIGYGIIDSLAVYSEEGASFSVSNTTGGRFFRRSGDASSRPTGRGRADETDVVQGRPALEPRFELPARPKVETWQAAPVSDDQLRNPLGVIPPAVRPRVILRFGEQKDLLVSGLLDSGAEIAERPAVVDIPRDQGHVVLFAINPIYRGSTIGSYFMVFNTILHFDHLGAGRVLDEK